MIDVEVGEEVVRYLAGKIAMRLKVTEVTEDLITCAGGWTFDPATGVEIDEDLGWGPRYGVTGSFIEKAKE